MIVEAMQVRQSQLTFGVDCFAEALAKLDLAETYSKVFLISQQQIWDFHGAAVDQALASLSITPVRRMVPDGEETKNLDVFAELLSWLADQGADRKSLIMVLGGGVVGDLCGFVASAYMRGMDWLYIPTTLLAQQDASIGGKTGVNLAQGKNLVGAFWEPKAVIIDASVLSTLPKREVVAGYMEWLKHGILRGEDLYRQVLAAPIDGDWAEVLPLLAEGIKVKIDIVREDPHEKGVRKKLNLGHTFGHALESYTNYHLFLHGEAVGLGLIYVTIVAELLGSTYDWSDLVAVVKQRVPAFDAEDWDRDAILDLTQLDKKGVKGIVSWIIPYEPGRCEIVKGVSRDVLNEAADRFFTLMR